MSTHKNSGDQATLGYRPLSSAVPARGPDLRTTAYIVVGVALGVVTGTLVADGSLERVYTQAFHPAVQASTVVAGAARTPDAKAAPSPLPDSKGVAPSAPANTSAVAQNEVKIAAHPVLAAVKAPASHKSKASLRLVGWHGRAGRRHGHGRHRPHAVLKAAGTGLTPKADAPRPQDADQFFVFAVEGNATVANYDATARMIETYEGETFELGNTANDGVSIAWLDYPADVQYRCDQSWNCTLSRTGGVVLSARRTR